MKKISVKKNIKKKNYSSPAPRFLDLANQFIDRFYPHHIKITAENTSAFVINALAYTDKAIIAAFAYKDLTKLKTHILSEISKLKIAKYPPSHLIYLVDIKFPNSSEQTADLNLQLSDNGYRVIIYTEETTTDSLIRSYSSPSHIDGSNLKDHYDRLYNAPLIEDEVIEEIFSFLNSESKVSVKIRPFDTHFSNLKDKILVNFHKNFYSEIKNCYNIHWSDKECVDHFINRNYHQYENQLYGLLEIVHNYFSSADCNHDGVPYHPVNNPSLFEELTFQILPSEKHTDLRYTNAAKAIILFFFEYCDFGKKTPNDPQTLFPKMDGDDDTPD